VIAEIAVMYFYPNFADRFAARHLLFLSFAASAVRWLGMGLVDDPIWIIVLSAIHGLTFGSFYVASVAFVAARVPSELRASGQALLVSITFGIGGLLGFLSAGRGYDLLGGHRLFMAAAALEVVAALIAVRLKPPPAAAPTVEYPPSPRVGH
jgi:PPP family 3-phenylpropionic acid transporter